MGGSMSKPAKPVNLLKHARSIIDKRGWTKKEYARDKSGQYVPYYSAGAQCFCSVGALYRAVHEQSDPAAINAFDAAESMLLGQAPHGEYRSLPAFNDAPETTKEDVLNMFDRAIEAA